MLVFANFIYLTLLSLILHSTSNTYQIHESRQYLPPGWILGPRIYPNHVLSIQIALRQSNLDKMDEYVMQVSDPTSSHYGNHWSFQQVRETFQPLSETVENVSDWLIKSGIKKDRLNLFGSWIKFDASIKEIEELLQTEYYRWTEEKTSNQFIAIAHNYSLPSLIRPHIDFIIPTIHFEKYVLNSSQERRTVSKQTPQLPSSPKLILIQNPEEEIQRNSIKNCDQHITPACLRALYGIPMLSKEYQTNLKNGLNIVGFQPQGFSSSDLGLFFQTYSIDQKYQFPNLISIDGGRLNGTSKGIEDAVETNLDLQYGMTLVNPIPVTLFQMGDKLESATFNDFLDAFDSSYCKGDDKKQDRVYPDPLQGGYKGRKDCGSHQLGKVISISYTYNEMDFTPSYAKRQCNEFAKLALVGTTFIVSSSDHGVEGVHGGCFDPITKTFSKKGRFIPSFPASCPYVLSVGATRIELGNDVFQPEIACSDFISSGGGFSNLFEVPKYQKSTVQHYFQFHKPLYSSEQYNDSQNTRGYPDVSGNGANFVTVIEGKYYTVWGTSASTPVIAAIFTLINEARLNAGKPSIGFVNPALYKNPKMFNDITKGNNPGCGTKGFTAVEDWDPVTGLGTPNFSKMLDYFLRL